MMSRFDILTSALVKWPVQAWTRLRQELIIAGHRGTRGWWRSPAFNRRYQHRSSDTAQTSPEASKKGDKEIKADTQLSLAWYESYLYLEQPWL